MHERRFHVERLEERRLLSATTSGLTPVRIEEVEFVGAFGAGATARTEPVEIGPAAYGYALAQREALGLSPADDFRVRSVFTGMDGLEHVRLDQQIGGVRVWGADVVVHLTPEDGQVLFVSGNLLQDAELANFEATVSADQAINVGKSEYVSWALPPSPTLPAEGRELFFERESAELVVYVGAGEPTLAWHVEFFTDQQAGLDPGLWNFFVDAQSAQIVDWFDGLAHLSQASGPGGNPKVGSRPWVDALDVEDTGTPDLYMMDTNRQVTTNMGNTTAGTGTVVTGPLDPIGDAAINDAHGFTELTLDMLEDWFGYDSIDDAGFEIRSRVHYGVNYPNAGWDGMGVYYGDGGSAFSQYPFSGALDIVAHEVHHGFTQFHSGLILVPSGAPGALNESFSDVAGTLAEFYVEGLAADFHIGEDVNYLLGFIRSMSDPTVDGNSVDDAILFRSNINIHFTAGIGNKAFVLTALRFSSGSPTGTATIEGVRRAGEAWFLANESYWTTTTDYTQGGQGVYDAAEALGFTAEELLAIRDSWADVGVFFEGGVRQYDDLLTGASGTLTSPNFPSNYPNNYKHTWAIDPPGPAPATLTFSSFNTQNLGDWVEVRNEAGALLSRTTGTALPPPATSARLLVTFATNPTTTASGWSATWTSPAIAPSADFDGDSDVDGLDFLAWQRGYGTASATPADGDADFDEDVDSDDLSVWEEQYGDGGELSAVSGQRSALAEIAEFESVEASSSLSTYWIASPFARGEIASDVGDVVNDDAVAEAAVDRAFEELAVVPRGVREFGDIAVRRVGYRCRLTVEDIGDTVAFDKEIDVLK